MNLMSLALENYLKIWYIVSFRTGKS